MLPRRQILQLAPALLAQPGSAAPAARIESIGVISPNGELLTLWYQSKVSEPPMAELRLARWRLS